MLPPWEFQDPSCKGIDTDIFYPEENSNPGRYQREQFDTDTVNLIRTICGGCVERKACFEWALYNETHGVWAGTTPAQREALRKKHNIIIKGEEEVA